MSHLCVRMASRFAINQSISRSFSTIKSVFGRMVFDCRGIPTVEVDIVTKNGKYTATAGSGKKFGTHQAREVRDGGLEYLGLGVNKAVDNINSIIAPHIIGLNCISQESVDNMLLTLDGTDNKSNLGSNAMIATSYAVAKAGAGSKNIPLYDHIKEMADKDKVIIPVPIVDIINSGITRNIGLSFKSINIMPIYCSNFSEAMKVSCEIYSTIRDDIKLHYGIDNINVDEYGALKPFIKDIREGIDLILNNITKLNYNNKIRLYIDFNASDMYNRNSNNYNLYYKDSSKNKEINRDELIKIYSQLCHDYPIVSLENPFDYEDFKSYTELVRNLGDKIQIVGDDLLESNPNRVVEAIERESCNSLLLKSNQIGTLSEYIETCLTAQSCGWGVIVSHRSGETEGHFISDLAVGLKCGQIKCGAPCRSERLSKYNQLLRIEEELGKSAIYAGRDYIKSHEI